MILLIINNKQYHYEIIESVIVYFHKILNTQQLNVPPTIYLEIIHNPSFVSYIKNKYPHILINKGIFFRYDYLINCSVYTEDYEVVRSHSASNKHYICHDLSKHMKSLKNVHFLTPIQNNKYFYADVLPFYKDPKIKTELPIYIIQGELSNSRRDFSLLKNILSKNYKYEFKFLLIGKGPPCLELLTIYEQYPNKIDIKCDMNFIDYHKEFLSCYCIFPCISKESNPVYYTNKLTSSINYARAYNLHILLDSSLQSIYNCKHAFVYQSTDKLTDHFKKTLKTFYHVPSYFRCFCK